MTSNITNVGKYSEDVITKMLDILADKIFVVFAGKSFQEIVGIQLGKNCAPPLVDIFSTHMKQNLYSLCSQREGDSWHLGSISHVLSINNQEFVNYLGQMYPVKL